MCGLFGAISTTLSKSEVSNVTTLGYLSVFRGAHSTGLGAMVRRKSKAHYAIKKSTEPAGVFFSNPSTYEWLEKEVTNPYLLLGHTRAATSGVLSAENAHPFHFGRILGTHNGCFGAFDDPKDVVSDSYNFFKEMNESNFETVMEKAYTRLGKLAYALVWFDGKEMTLNIYRNKERPLWLMSNQAGSTWYWASERRMLKFMDLGDSGAVHMEPVIVEPDKLYQMKYGERKFSTKNITFTKKYTSASSDWWKTADTESKRSTIYDYPRRDGVDDYLRQQNYHADDNQRALNREIKRAKKEKNKKQTGVVIELESRLNKRFNYIGFNGIMMSQDVAEHLLNQGCASCVNVNKPEEDTFWFTPDDYMCSSCYHAPFARELTTGISGTTAEFNAHFSKGRILPIENKKVS